MIIIRMPMHLHFRWLIVCQFVTVIDCWYGRTDDYSAVIYYCIIYWPWPSIIVAQFTWWPVGVRPVLALLLLRTDGVRTDIVDQRYYLLVFSVLLTIHYYVWYDLLTMTNDIPIQCLFYSHLLPMRILPIWKALFMLIIIVTIAGKFMRTDHCEGLYCLLTYLFDNKQITRICGSAQLMRRALGITALATA